MPRVSFYGSSDDNFEINGGGIDDEVGCYNDVVVIEVLAPGDKPINVVGEYARHSKGNWMVGLQNSDDDTWPSWCGGDNLEWKLDKRGVSAMLTIEVPAGTVLRQLWPERGECGECGRAHDLMEWVVK